MITSKMSFEFMQPEDTNNSIFSQFISDNMRRLTDGIVLKALAPEYNPSSFANNTLSVSSITEQIKKIQSQMKTVLPSTRNIIEDPNMTKTVIICYNVFKLQKKGKRKSWYKTGETRNKIHYVPSQEIYFAGDKIICHPVIANFIKTNVTFNNFGNPL